MPKSKVILPVKRYDHRVIEKHWQTEWEAKSTFHPVDMLPAENKFYNLWMFPYPSAEGLHAGHAFASTGSDIYGRFMRMHGREVFQPIGYDSFGIHSENYALKIKELPQEVVRRTTKKYEQQMKSLGQGYDWTRTVTTSDVGYYQWTQWLFTEMFKAGLAYRKSATVNWCPSCKTVLADEQVMTPRQAGKIPYGYQSMEEVPEGIIVCERCGTVVEKKELEQWFFRITDYADKLLENLNKIDWPEKIKTAQRNWIGKKEGINITYPVIVGEINQINPQPVTRNSLTVWTSRPDTNFGATFIVIAPEHPLVKALTTKDQEQSVSEYIKASLSKSKEERIAEGREKTGVFTGSYAVNQLTGRRMPIYVTDFVLMDVGTGAVVGVPGHDMRDFQFAKRFDLPIIRVVAGSDGDTGEITGEEQVQEEEGTIVNSEFLNGMDIHEATKKIMDYLVEKGWGVRADNYHLRDWLVSRQRYWGPPIPMIYCETCAKKGKSWFNSTMSEECLKSRNNENLNNNFIGNWKLKIENSAASWQSVGWFPAPVLPVELPLIKDYQPEGNGKGPLAKHPEFYETVCPNCGSPARRETDVSDTFVDSSWYFLRYPSARSARSGQAPFDKDITGVWLPVDLYFGGAEHAVLHLMYCRFVTMVYHDLGYVPFEEPVLKFFAHGLMIKDGAKMSKSRGNVVNPDEYIEKFGADTLRLYLMFMGPMDGYPDFRDTGIEGMYRFIGRVWNLLTGTDQVALTDEQQSTLRTKLHQTIKKVTRDIEGFRYNTAISALMELVGLMKDFVPNTPKFPDSPKGKSDQNSWLESKKILTLLLAPFAPHLAEEVWVNYLGQEFSVHRQNWPVHDPQLIVENSVNIVIQVNGKLRGTIEIEKDQANDKERVLSAAKAEPSVAKWLEGKEIIKEIYVPAKLVNFVVK